VVRQSQPGKSRGGTHSISTDYSLNRQSNLAPIVCDVTGKLGKVPQPSSTQPGANSCTSLSRRIVGWWAIARTVVLGSELGANRQIAASLALLGRSSACPWPAVVDRQHFGRGFLHGSQEFSVIKTATGPTSFSCPKGRRCRGRAALGRRRACGARIGGDKVCIASRHAIRPAGQIGSMFTLPFQPGGETLHRLQAGDDTRS
jgi:hypothetical protein